MTRHKSGRGNEVGQQAPLGQPHMMSPNGCPLGDIMQCWATSHDIVHCHNRKIPLPHSVSVSKASPYGPGNYKNNTYDDQQIIMLSALILLSFSQSKQTVQQLLSFCSEQKWSFFQAKSKLSSILNKYSTKATPSTHALSCHQNSFNLCTFQIFALISWWHGKSKLLYVSFLTPSVKLVSDSNGNISFLTGENIFPRNTTFMNTF